MQVTARAKYLHRGPRKLRRYAVLVVGKQVHIAQQILAGHTSPAVRDLLKVINSAIANGENNLGLEPEELAIKQILVDEGVRMPRIRPRARGRADRYHKKTCHVTVVLDDGAVDEENDA